VASNSRLRQRLQDAAQRRNIELILPPTRYCIDNAAMTAGIAHHLHAAGHVSDLTLDAAPTVRKAPGG
jgi:N6-L-threonylcarbamoyladenine synthase